MDITDLFRPANQNTFSMESFKNLADSIRQYKNPTISINDNSDNDNWKVEEKPTKKATKRTRTKKPAVESTDEVTKNSAKRALEPIIVERSKEEKGDFKKLLVAQTKLLAELRSIKGSLKKRETAVTKLSATVKKNEKETKALIKNAARVSEKKIVAKKESETVDAFTPDFHAYVDSKVQTRNARRAVGPVAASISRPARTTSNNPMRSIASRRYNPWAFDQNPWRNVRVLNTGFNDVVENRGQSSPSDIVNRARGESTRDQGLGTTGAALAGASVGVAAASITRVLGSLRSVIGRLSSGTNRLLSGAARFATLNPTFTIGLAAAGIIGTAIARTLLLTDEEREELRRRANEQAGDVPGETPQERTNRRQSNEGNRPQGLYNERMNVDPVPGETYEEWEVRQMQRRQQGLEQDTPPPPRTPPAEPTTPTPRPRPPSEIDLEDPRIQRQQLPAPSNGRTPGLLQRRREQNLQPRSSVDRAAAIASTAPAAPAATSSAPIIIAPQTNVGGNSSPPAQIIAGAPSTSAPATVFDPVLYQARSPN